MWAWGSQVAGILSPISRGILKNCLLPIGFPLHIDVCILRLNRVYKPRKILENIALTHSLNWIYLSLVRFCFSALCSKAVSWRKRNIFLKGKALLLLLLGRLLTRGVLHKWVFSGFRWEKGAKPSVRLQQDCLFCFCFVLFCFVFKWKRNVDLRPSNLFFLFSNHD